MTRRDLEALRRERDDAARKADQLTDQYDRWPNVDIREARDAAVRLVNAYDRTLAELST
jgi:hypothetical protein